MTLHGPSLYLFSCFGVVIKRGISRELHKLIHSIHLFFKVDEISKKKSFFFMQLKQFASCTTKTKSFHFYVTQK